jgi:hypothetical protein
VSICIKCNEPFDGNGKLAQRLREMAAERGKPKPPDWEPKVCSMCLWQTIEDMCAELEQGECTPVEAHWCPRCGDCTCPHPEDELSSDGCPLHDPRCDHGDNVDPEYA